MYPGDNYLLIADSQEQFNNVRNLLRLWRDPVHILNPRCRRPRPLVQEPSLCSTLLKHPIDRLRARLRGPSALNKLLVHTSDHSSSFQLGRWDSVALHPIDLVLPSATKQLLPAACFAASMAYCLPGAPLQLQPRCKDFSHPRPAAPARGSQVLPRFLQYKSILYYINFHQRKPQKKLTDWRELPFCFWWSVSRKSCI